jgi:hypothetical protein
MAWIWRLMIMKCLYRGLSVILIILGLVAFLAVSIDNAVAQEETIKITDQSTETNFREQLTFTISAESKAEIFEADLLYKIVGQLATSRNNADFTPGTSIDAEFVIDQSEPANYLPPGVELQYWWKIVDADGNEVTTEKGNLLYLDDRYDWQTLENERLTLYWYEGSDEFGQELFDRANGSLDTLEADFGVTLENSIRIFIYADHDDFLGAYFTSGQEWAGGAAFDEYGVVMMTVDPRQPEWGTVITTHEMTHLVVHQATENPFGGDLTLPRWLDEGIAVYTSGEIYTRSDFNTLLKQAIKNDELLTLRTLSSPFPADPDEAVLSYAQSGAVVKFIVDTYGAEVMAELLNALAEGALYDEALVQALGVDTDGLDNAFRASLDLPPLPNTEASTAAETEPSQETSTTETEEVTEGVTDSQESEESPESIKEATSEESPVQPAPETTEKEKSSPLGLPCCMAGMLPLLVLGYSFYILRSR